MLLPIVTLLCIVAAWLALFPTTPPLFMITGQLALVAILAAVIAVRRRAAPLARVASAVGFFISCCLVSAYGGFAASALQAADHERTRHPWAGLDDLVVALTLVGCFPFVILLLTWMLRTWTWAAHDREIFAGLERDADERREPGS
jgi:hypothetical protein